MKIGIGIGIPNSKPASGGIGVDADYQALLDAASGDLPTSGTQDAQNTLVADLKSAGVWTKLDLLYVFATDGGADIARRNWKAPSSFQCLINGTPSFTSLEGYASNGGGWLDTQWSPANNGVQYQQNSASMGVYTQQQPDATSFGTRDGTGASDPNIIPRYDFNSVGINSSPNINPIVLPPAGFTFLNRASSTGFSVYSNGSEYATYTETSIGAPAQLLSILARRTGTTTANLAGTHTVSIFFAGASLASEAAAFFTAVEKYMDAIGKGVVA